MPPSKTSRSSKSRTANMAPTPGGSTPAPKKKKRAAPKAAPAKVTARPRKPVSKVLAVVTVLGGGVLLMLAILVGFLDGYGQKNRARKSDAIVVLGARVRPDGKAGQGLQLRVLHAVRLYKKGFAKKIIMTGGVGDNPPSEAQVAAALAIKNGVPREDIVQENKSTSTWENAAYASAICKKRKWKSVLIVSDPFHLWRAQKNFQKCGMRASVSPVTVEQWKLQPARRLFWTTREAILSVRDWCLRRV